MGKLYTAVMPDGSRRFAADFGMGRAQLFYEITLLLEKHVNMPSGISDDNGMDEHIITSSLFIPFFEAVWETGWILDLRGGFLGGWAAHAAGMIENITLQKRQWTDRNGIVLEVQRCLRPKEIAKLSR